MLNGQICLKHYEQRFNLCYSIPAHTNRHCEKRGTSDEAISPTSTQTSLRVERSGAKQSPNL